MATKIEAKIQKLEQEKSELDLLEFDHQKRNVTRKARQKMFMTTEHMKMHLQSIWKAAYHLQVTM